jgi:hypothetical protein
MESEPKGCGSIKSPSLRSKLDPGLGGDNKKNKIKMWEKWGISEILKALRFQKNSGRIKERMSYGDFLPHPNHPYPDAFPRDSGGVGGIFEAFLCSFGAKPQLFFRSSWLVLYVPDFAFRVKDSLRALCALCPLW